MITALKNAIDLIPVNGGSVAIVKPTDEELFAPNNPKGFTGKLLGQPGLKLSVRVSETGFREVVAYDYDISDMALQVFQFPTYTELESLILPMFNPGFFICEGMRSMVSNLEFPYFTFSLKKHTVTILKKV
ncbi:hypothetical protein L2E82_48918 [Cichorium intybus]|uniref:Uncharacterized protein n=1 Tax=Cichorium intybus TaxID=13427 RepID=A0ACB8YY88_CICIN|nr:hypothetical protein L2E82_48918 [Cichorium intybus]